LFFHTKDGTYQATGNILHIYVHNERS